MNRSMQRARNAARTAPFGVQILDYLASPHGRKRLTMAADKGDPPILAVSSKLVEIAGADTLNAPGVRSFVGIAIRAVLEEENYEVSRSGVRLNTDANFITGAVYRRSHQPKTGGATGLLERWVAALSDEEIEALLAIVRRRKQTKTRAAE